MPSAMMGRSSAAPNDTIAFSSGGDMAPAVKDASSFSRLTGNSLIRPNEE